MEKVKMSILRSHKPTSPFLFIFLRVLGVSVVYLIPLSALGLLTSLSIASLVTNSF